jgi:hypothetical protein
MPGSNARRFAPQNLLEVCTWASIHDPRTRRRQVSLDRQDLERLCQQTLAETDFKGLGSRFVGKVRDSYVAARPGERAIVVSDRGADGLPIALPPHDQPRTTVSQAIHEPS